MVDDLTIRFIRSISVRFCGGGKLQLSYGSSYLFMVLKMNITSGQNIRNVNLPVSEKKNTFADGLIHLFIYS